MPKFSLTAMFVASLFCVTSSLPISASATTTAERDTSHPLRIMKGIDCDPREASVPATQTGTPQTALAAGDNDLENDHCLSAIANYSRFIDAHPESVKGYWRRALSESAKAMASNDLGQFDKVVDDMDKAIALDPNVADFYLIRGTGKSALIKGILFSHPSLFKIPHKLRYSYADVFADLSKAIALSPTLGEAYVSRFSIDLVMRDNQQAAYDFRKSTELDPDDLNDYEAGRAELDRQMNETYARAAAVAVGLFITSMAADGY